MCSYCNKTLAYTYTCLENVCFDKCYTWHFCVTGISLVDGNPGADCVLFPPVGEDSWCCPQSISRSSSAALCESSGSVFNAEVFGKNAVFKIFRLTDV